MNTDFIEGARRVTFNFHVTLIMALGTLQSIVQRFGPDHVGTLDGGCAYVVNSKHGRLTPSCIVGQAFSDWGILRALLTGPGSTAGMEVEGCDLSNKGGVNFTLRQDLRDNFGITFDDEAWTLLGEAQMKQDNGIPWGQAVEDAAQRVENRRGGAPLRTAVERLLNA